MTIRILRTVAYFAVLMAVIQCVAEVLRPKDLSKQRIDGFDKEVKGSLDVVCVGSSHAFCTWNPVHLYKRFGIRSCVYGSESQPIEASLAFVKRALKIHRPKVVFLESFMFSCASGDKKTKVPPAHRAVDSYPWGIDRILMIESMVPAGSKEAMYLDVRQYHSRWKSLGKEDFSLYGKRDCCHGCQLIGKVAPVSKYLHNFDKIWDRGINAYLAVRLDQINRLVKAHGAELVVFTAPFNAVTENARFCKGLSRFLKSRDIEYLNFIDQDCGLELDVKMDFADNKDGHLNVYGMEKVMDFIGKELRDRHNLIPDGRYEDEWKSDIEQYEKLRDMEIAKWQKSADEGASGQIR